MQYYYDAANSSVNKNQTYRIDDLFLREQLHNSFLFPQVIELESRYTLRRAKQD